MAATFSVMTAIPVLTVSFSARAMALTLQRMGIARPMERARRVGKLREAERLHFLAAKFGMMGFKPAVRYTDERNPDKRRK